MHTSDDLKMIPGSIISRTSIVASVAKFLRTHRDGYRCLHELLASVPEDRTEEEYRAEVEAGERRFADNLALVKARYAAGLPLVDINDLLVETPEAPQA